MIPSPDFTLFVHAAVEQALKAPSAMSSDFFEHRLWVAASYDWFAQSGYMVWMIDAKGRPIDPDSGYAVLICKAVKQSRKGRADHVFRDDSRRYFPLEERRRYHA